MTLLAYRSARCRPSPAEAAPTPGRSPEYATNGINFRGSMLAGVRGINLGGVDGGRRAMITT
jgi:hypothetical protein